jgi:hypothetical protein
MYSDLSDLSFLESGSHLLSESTPQFSSNTGPGGDDLSISELSLSDRVRVFQRPFSLLAQPQVAQEPTTPNRDGSDVPYDGEGELEGELDQDQNDVDAEKNKRLTAKSREEKLQSDAFILKKLNASFALFNETLADTAAANEVPGFFTLSQVVQYERDFSFAVSSCAAGTDRRALE